MWHFPNKADEDAYELAFRQNINVLGVRFNIYYSNQPKNKPTYSYGRDVILGTNLQYNNQATDNSTFNLGTCYIETLKIEFDSDKARGVKGATKLTLFQLEAGYGTPDGEIKYVPLGWYKYKDRTSSEKNNKYVLELTSYMTLLDDDLPNSVKQTGLTASCNYWLNYMCGNIDVQQRSDGENIKMQLSSKMSDPTYTSKFNSLNRTITVNANTGHVTYRDVLRDIAQMNCAFATFDRDGKLLLVPFEGDSEPHYTLQYGDLMNYTENLDQFSIDAVRYAAGDREYIYNGSAPDGLWHGEVYQGEYLDISDNKTMSMYSSDDYDNPDYGEWNIIKILENIYKALCSVSNRSEGERTTVGYTSNPFELTLPRPDFRLDLGDWIDYFVTKSRTTASSAQIMRINYNLPGSCKIYSYASPDSNDTNSGSKPSATGGNKTTSGGSEPATKAALTTKWFSYDREVKK